MIIINTIRLNVDLNFFDIFTAQNDQMFIENAIPTCIILRNTKSKMLLLLYYICNLNFFLIDLFLLESSCRRGHLLFLFATKTLRHEEYLKTSNFP